ncbi:hypothetical protein [uncultured Sphingomonas sp.]|uniref:hypothetical protein n=1 Tax=uncultured Sphingomonas sp. TaxID=158754 RepID=UPI0035CB0545
MRFGPNMGPVVVLALPLFEEANRTRAVAVAVLRALAGIGMASALPELPGQGESLLPTRDATLVGIREAFEGAVGAVRAEGRPAYVAAIRSGALLDLSALAHGRWHLSPQDGAELLGALTRIKQQEIGRERRLGDRWYLDGDVTSESPVSIAGSLIAPQLLNELPSAMPFDQPDVPRRILRLYGDPRPADRHIAGTPPWRRAEPGNDDVLAQILAADLADWVRTCAAR